MIYPALENELRQQLDKLPLDKQRQVLDFARSLSEARPRGVPGRNLVRFGGRIDAADLAVIARAVEEDCEQVHPDEW